MKRIFLPIIGLLCAVLLAGCSTGTTTTPPQTNTNASPVSQAAPSSQPTDSAAANPATNTNTPPTSTTPPTQTAPATPASGPDIVPQALLRGTYALSEVQHDGLVEMISSDNTTEITFNPPASFTRVSKRGGKIDHTDSGEYDVFGNKELILKIMMSKQQIQLRPVVKRHPFTLSADGNEFRLASEKRGVAVFRRTKLPPESK